MDKKTLASRCTELRLRPVVENGRIVRLDISDFETGERTPCSPAIYAGLGIDPNNIGHVANRFGAAVPTLGEVDWCEGAGDWVPTN